MQKYNRFSIRQAFRLQCSSRTLKKTALFSAPVANQLLAESATTPWTLHIPHRTPHSQRKNTPQPASVENLPPPNRKKTRIFALSIL